MSRGKYKRDKKNFSLAVLAAGYSLKVILSQLRAPAARSLAMLVGLGSSAQTEILPLV